MVIILSIESDVFNKSIINIELLEKYGFIKEYDNYIYERNFLNNNFKAIINIDKNGKVKGKVIDLLVNEEYLGLRTNMIGEFTNKIREYNNYILIYIENNCYINRYCIFL